MRAQRFGVSTSTRRQGLLSRRDGSGRSRASSTVRSQRADDRASRSLSWRQLELALFVGLRALGGGPWLRPTAMVLGRGASGSPATPRRADAAAAFPTMHAAWGWLCVGHRQEGGSAGSTLGLKPKALSYACGMNDVLGESSMRTPAFIVGRWGHGREVLDVSSDGPSRRREFSSVFLSRTAWDLDEVKCARGAVLGSIDQLESAVPYGADCRTCGQRLRFVIALGRESPAMLVSDSPSRVGGATLIHRREIGPDVRLPPE